jgi:mediator of RNA polymerase II transcription subunit 7
VTAQGFSGRENPGREFVVTLFHRAHVATAPTQKAIIIFLAAETPIMAEKQEQLEIHSTFPQPPPFWKSFTSENLERLEQYKKDNGDATSDNEAKSQTQLSAPQLLALPAELRYLVPPEPPADDDEYRVFNQLTKTHRTDEFRHALEIFKNDMAHAGVLPDWEYQQLYPSRPAGNDSEWSLDHKKYLMKYLHYMLLKFLEIVGIMYSHPGTEDMTDKIKDIATLAANVHALVNEYRPHQARETLINIMQEQVDRKRAEIEAIKRMKERVAESLSEIASRAPDGGAAVRPEDATTVSPDDKRRTMQRHMWHAMDEILGH